MRATRRPPCKGPHECGLSKLSSMHVEVDVVSRRIGTSDGPKAIDETDAYRSKSSGIPRKEVIQPQLPLRLPCYDFTPIIDPTFDGCLLRRG